jgi:MFS family permease
MPLAGRLADQFGSARLSRPAAAAVAVLPLFLWTAHTLAAVMMTVLAFGVAGGMMSVGVNAQGVQVEQAYGRPLMASFHASFSLGGLAGALLGGLLAWRQVVQGGHPQMDALVGLVLAGVAVTILAGRWLHREPGRRDVCPPARRRPGEWAGGWIAAGRLVLQRVRAVQPDCLLWRDWLTRPMRPVPRRPGLSRLTGLGLLALSCLIAEGAVAICGTTWMPRAGTQPPDSPVSPWPWPSAESPVTASPPATARSAWSADAACWPPPAWPPRWLATARLARSSGSRPAVAACRVRSRSSSRPPGTLIRSAQEAASLGWPASATSAWSAARR